MDLLCSPNAHAREGQEVDGRLLLQRWINRMALSLLGSANLVRRAVGDQSALMREERRTGVETSALGADGKKNEAFGGITVGLKAAGEDMLGGQCAKRRINVVDGRQKLGRKAAHF